MRVWIDQDLCTGDGLCEDHAPDVFALLEDGIAYVKEADQILNDPGGSGSLAFVPERLYQQVVNAMADAVLAVHPWAEQFLFPAKRDAFDEIEQFAKQEFGGDLLKKGKLLKVVDKMRKAAK